MAQAAPPAVSQPAAREVDRLREALDLDRLVGLGWDSATWVLTPDPAHPVLGYAACPVTGCRNEGRLLDGLCCSCVIRRALDASVDLAAFCAKGTGDRRRSQPRLCAVCCVPGAQRPAIGNALCTSCNHLRLMRGQSAQAFATGDSQHPPATPHPSLGECVVPTCHRLAARINGLCDAHDQRWRATGRPELAGFIATGTPRRGDNAGRVVMAGLPERVILELLYGIQASLASGRKLSPTNLRATVKHLRSSGARSIASLNASGLPVSVRRFVEFCADRLGLLDADLETECRKDVWDLRLWGGHGHLSFCGSLRPTRGEAARPITQRWLTTAAKAWAADALSSRSPACARRMVHALGLLSGHLDRRPDRGEDPSAIERRDLEGFHARLGRLVAAGTLSVDGRVRVVDALAMFLRDARSLGLTRPGEAMAGLADDIVVRASDHPPRQRGEDDEAGRALPDAVVAQLLSPENLGRLERASGPTGRAAVELMAGVGRRTGELCTLALTCLDYDEHVGSDAVRRRSPVLVYDMPKVDRVGCRLPIHDREAAIISAQQARVRARFGATPDDRLVLFPRPLKNPQGTSSISPGWLQRQLSSWVEALPYLDSPERDASGAAVPFPRDAVFPYAFRHTFAQRHADSGTPVDTLKELLGHDTLRATLGYYRVTPKRKREAQDRLGPLQLNAGGTLVRPGMAGLSRAEALRDEVGQVAVPFGVCTEPTNVAAGGQSCPFRHRCLGCEYFRTDASYQPELNAYLSQLLVDRQRLATALPQLADWARRDAAPSDEEIETLRRLLRSNQVALAGLDEQDRQAVEAAIATVRKDRANLEATFPVELRGLVAQSRPVLFPTIERVHRGEAAHG
jgi:integrase